MEARIPSDQLYESDRSFIRFGENDLKKLAFELRANEFKLRSELTPLNLMQMLANNAADPAVEMEMSRNTRQVR